MFIQCPICSELHEYKIDHQVLAFACGFLMEFCICHFIPNKILKNTKRSRTEKEVAVRETNNEYYDPYRYLDFECYNDNEVLEICGVCLKLRATSNLGCDQMNTF